MTYNWYDVYPEVATKPQFDKRYFRSLPLLNSTVPRPTHFILHKTILLSTFTFDHTWCQLCCLNKMHNFGIYYIELNALNQDCTHLSAVFLHLIYSFENRLQPSYFLYSIPHISSLIIWCWPRVGVSFCSNILLKLYHNQLSSVTWNIERVSISFSRDWRKNILVEAASNSCFLLSFWDTDLTCLLLDLHTYSYI